MLYPCWEERNRKSCRRCSSRSSEWSRWKILLSQIHDWRGARTTYPGNSDMSAMTSCYQAQAENRDCNVHKGFGLYESGTPSTPMCYICSDHECCYSAAAAVGLLQIISPKTLFLRIIPILLHKCWGAMYSNSWKRKTYAVFPVFNGIVSFAIVFRIISCSINPFLHSSYRLVWHVIGLMLEVFSIMTRRTSLYGSTKKIIPESFLCSKAVTWRWESFVGFR